MSQAVTEDFGMEGIEDARTSGNRIHAGDLGGGHLGRRLLQPECQLIELRGGGFGRSAWSLPSPLILYRCNEPPRVFHIAVVNLLKLPPRV
jgi:hypothetical protein